jgi:hypothetical protein
MATEGSCQTTSNYNQEKWTSNKAWGAEDSLFSFPLKPKQTPMLNTSGDHYSQHALIFKSLIQKQFEAWSESLLAIPSYYSQNYLKWFPHFIFDLYQALETWRVQLREALQDVTNMPDIINDLKEYVRTRCAAWHSDLQQYNISIPEPDKGDAVDISMMVPEWSDQVRLIVEHVDTFPRTMALADHIKGCGLWHLQMRETWSSLGLGEDTYAVEMYERTNFTSMLEQALLPESPSLDWVDVVAADEL